MGFLDDLMDKAAEFGDRAGEGPGTAGDPLDGEEELTSAEEAEAATTADYSPEAVERASQGIDDAMAESTAAAATSAAPAADPLDLPVESVDSVLEPTRPASTEDPLEPADYRPA